MTFISKKIKILLAILVLILIGSLGGLYYASLPYYPTVQGYIADLKSAKVIPPHHYFIDGHKAVCGNRPTVLHDDFDSWGGAYPDFIIINAKAIKSLLTPVKLYIYYHECGHQHKGKNETMSDVFAISQGVSSGWIKNKDDMDKICHFVSKIPADAEHPIGILRCKIMRLYYQLPKTSRTCKKTAQSNKQKYLFPLTKSMTAK